MVSRLRAWWLRKAKEKAAAFTTEDILDLLDATEQSEEHLTQLHFLRDRLADLERRAADLALQSQPGRTPAAPAVPPPTSGCS